MNNCSECGNPLNIISQFEGHQYFICPYCKTRFKRRDPNVDLHNYVRMKSVGDYSRMEYYKALDKLISDNPDEYKLKPVPKQGDEDNE